MPPFCLFLLQILVPKCTNMFYHWRAEKVGSWGIRCLFHTCQPCSIPTDCQTENGSARDQLYTTNADFSCWQIRSWIDWKIVVSLFTVFFVPFLSIQPVTLLCLVSPLPPKPLLSSQSSLSRLCSTSDIPNQQTLLSTPNKSECTRVCPLDITGSAFVVSNLCHQHAALS